jgi:MoaA/NifB/PqqE/SkfB family radical SAM enzyme
MCEEKSIPWDIPKNILKEIIQLFPYLEEIIWQGGEVLLLNYFEDLVEKANKFPSLHQSIITNGLPLTERLAEKLVRNNAELTFSIDAVTTELYESIRKGAEFKKLINNVKLINTLRKRLDLTSGMSFRMHTVIMDSNYLQLEKFIDFAKEYHFDALHLMPIWGNTDSKENIFYHKDSAALSYIKEHIEHAEAKAKEYGLNLLNSLPFSGNYNEDNEIGEKNGKKLSGNRLLCHMPWKRLVINPAGNVCPACHCREMVGNVLGESLNEIWNNEKMQMYRKKIVASDYEDLCNPNCIKGIISKELRGLN